MSQHNSILDPPEGAGLESELGKHPSDAEPCRLKTIFVDDEPDFEMLIRQRYRRQVRSGELQLEFARDGREALEKLSEDDEIAIVMTDINMPVMDGLTLLHELAALPRDIPAVIVSAYGDMSNIRTAMNRGAFDFLTKPIDFADLEITWQKTAAHCRQLHERKRLSKERRQLTQRLGFIRETFGRYLSDSVVERLLEHPDGLALGGERRDVTILMADLRGFSSLAERLRPEQCVTLLNNYFEVMIDLIMDHGGIIDELLGDAVLVIFGAPLVQENHARLAASCAVAMQCAMESLNRDNTDRGLPTIEMGIGINSGEVVVGNIGSHRRSKFGVVGSHVNLTARIERRSVGGQVLISGGTYRRCAEQLVVEQAPEFIAKGFHEPVEVYSLLEIKGAAKQKLPVQTQQLFDLTEPLALRFILLSDGSDDRLRDGRFLRLSEHSGILQCSDDGALDPITPIRIRLLNSAGEVDCDDLYAKAVERESDGNLRVVFTSIAPEARERIRAAIESARSAEDCDCSKQT